MAAFKAKTTLKENSAILSKINRKGNQLFKAYDLSRTGVKAREEHVECVDMSRQLVEKSGFFRHIVRPQTLLADQGSFGVESGDEADCFMNCRKRLIALCFARE